MPERALDNERRMFTRQEMEDTANAAATKAANEVLTRTFAMLGVNFQNFDSMQEFRDTIEWARTGRKLSQLTGARAWTAIVAIIAGGAAIAAWQWFQSVLPHR